MDCPEGFWCDRTVFRCREIECIPNCTGKCCGYDGCDGTCPDICPAGYTCNPVTCVCETYGCNTNADCTATQCCINWDCVDMNCGNLECGPDPVCGKECGPCPVGRDCVNGRCVNVEPSQLGDPCPFDTVNANDGYCDEGLVCLGILADGNAGTCPGGAATECTNLDQEYNRDCVNGNCGASFCSEPCGAQRNCPEGFVGLDIGDPPTCMCIPNRIIEDCGWAGDPCPFNGVNASECFCKTGNVCLGNVDIGSCPGGTDAECSGVPDTWNPDCVNGVCGFSFCTLGCDAQGNCPAGYMPADANGTCYCIGDGGETGQLGDPCPFGDMNNSYNFCMSGLTCLGNDDAGSCPGGSPTECGIPDIQNPDCVNGVCGFSHCSSRCDAQGNCPTGYAPVDVSGTCYCVPQETGNSQAGDPCPLGDVNSTADFCAADLTCLGFPADGQAGTCPGGNPTECIDIPANANPDCVNGNCGASFCAEQCDAQGPQGHCPAGFVCQDVGDTWFCVPA
jgi:hypothetical protein